MHRNYLRVYERIIYFEKKIKINTRNDDSSPFVMKSSPRERNEGIHLCIFSVWRPGERKKVKERVWWAKVVLP